MVILGCVRHLTDFSIEVELPGLTFGYINITRISDPFTKFLNKKLEMQDEEVICAFRFVILLLWCSYIIIIIF